MPFKRLFTIELILATCVGLYICFWYNYAVPMPKDWKSLHVGMTRLEAYKALGWYHKDRMDTYRMDKEEGTWDRNFNYLISRNRWEVWLTFCNGDDPISPEINRDPTDRLNDILIEMDRKTDIDAVFDLWPRPIYHS